VAYMDGATLGIDNKIDGKYINDSPIALTSNINGGEFTIQGRPTFDATDVVALNFKTNVAGDYTIGIDHVDGLFAAGQDVYLVDSKTGAETDLKAGAYTFTAVAGVDNARFSLKYQKTLKVDAPVFNENSVRIYEANGTLFVNSGSNAIGSVKVFDIQGRLIAERKNVKANVASISNLKATHQALIVKVTSEDNTVVNKKVVY
jgi:trimeric autotransporter adhesin